MNNSSQKGKKISDIRVMRPVMVREKSSNTVITLQQIETVSINGCDFSFHAPNNVSIFVSIAKRELNISRRIYQETVVEKTTKKKDFSLEEKDLSKLYTYFEHVQTCVVCVYTAIEALANVAIPNGYEYKSKSPKGVVELWDKEAIERWFKTSDKYTKLLPDILKIESPASKGFWSNFKKLEDIRNEIIHQKTSVSKSTDVDSKYLHVLLDEKIFQLIDSAFELISYICNSDQGHVFFPLGFGPAQIKIEEVSDFSESFELVKRAVPKR